MSKNVNHTVFSQFLKRSTVVTSISISLLATTLCNAGTPAAQNANQISSRPDALMQIDMNRNAVVERIVESWKKDISAGQAESFRNKLTQLRADQLLSANISGTFDGVLEIVNAKEVAQNAALKVAITEDQAKALGSTTFDLVYTPINPCRFIDTRGVFSPAYSGGAYGASTIRTYQTTGFCGIPAGAQGVMTQITVITPPAAGDIELLPNSSGFGGTAAMVFGAGVFSSVSAVARLNSSGQFSTQLRGQGGHVAMDITGYFIAPNATSLACEWWFTDTTFAAGSGYNGVNGPSCTPGRELVHTGCYTLGVPLANNYLATSGPSELGTATAGRCEWFVGGGSFTGRVNSKCCYIPGR
jgi:hypothetical protein